MSGLSRITTAAVLVTALGSVAHAQARRDAPVTPDAYEALSEGRSVAVERRTDVGGVVPPSESRTVMGLSVPR